MQKDDTLTTEDLLAHFRANEAFYPLIKTLSVLGIVALAIWCNYGLLFGNAVWISVSAVLSVGLVVLKEICILDEFPKYYAKLADKKNLYNNFLEMGLFLITCLMASVVLCSDFTLFNIYNTLITITLFYLCNQFMKRNTVYAELKETPYTHELNRKEKKKISSRDHEYDLRILHSDSFDNPLGVESYKLGDKDTISSKCSVKELISDIFVEWVKDLF